MYRYLYAISIYMGTPWLEFFFVLEGVYDYGDKSPFPPFWRGWRVWSLICSLIWSLINVIGEWWNTKVFCPLGKMSDPNIRAKIATEWMFGVYIAAFLGFRWYPLGARGRAPFRRRLALSLRRRSAALPFFPSLGCTSRCSENLASRSLLRRAFGRGGNAYGRFNDFIYFNSVFALALFFLFNFCCELFFKFPTPPFFSFRSFLAFCLSVAHTW